MLTPVIVATGLSTGLSFIGLGGGLYEINVVDPVWPKRPTIIQPKQGGISRRRFWVPAHAAFETSLVISLTAAWSAAPQVRNTLLVGLASHLAMRLWSFAHFIPQAMAFEETDAAVIEKGDKARRWTRQSRWRLLLD
ncbi:unnamed protein product, partial [Phaeothamnion confervicola]